MAGRAWVAVAVVSVMAVFLPPVTDSAEILMLTPFGSKSVQSLFWQVTEALTARGHRITLVTSGDPSPRPNVTHIKAPNSGLDQMDLFELRRDGRAFSMLLLALPHVARELYASPAVMSVWHNRHQYDAIIINSAVNEMAFPFLLGVKAPFITLSPTGTEPLQLSYLGNMVSPAALPSVILPYHDHLTLWERLVNTVAIAALRYFFRRKVAAPLTTTLQETFPDLPDPFTMYPRQALALLHRHHLLDGAVPLLPNQVEVGCLTCRPANPAAIPQNLSEWLNNGPDVVYFSLGSLQQASKVPPEYTTILFNAFANLPCRVLAKYSALPGPTPDNVRVEEWLPQQDILAHPKVKVFVTHCGKNSAGEGVYHGVPMVGLPITNDHPRTCARLARRGEAIVLQWEQLTEEALTGAVNDMLQDPSYRERVEGVSRRMKAQRESGLERAVWWIEYSIQHGDSYLRFSGADLSLAQYLLLDVLMILVAVGCLLLLSVCLITRTVYRCCRPYAHKIKAE